MDASSPMNPPNSHGTMDESSDSDSSLISFSSCASDDIDDSFSSTSSDGPLYEMDSLRANLPFNCKFLLDCWPTGESVVEVLPLEGAVQVFRREISVVYIFIRGEMFE
ncbi:uncharacterized protein LOC131037338 isoform X2 [Cryptomeria japonica]|uniref:uncharacterized protein LOC131037338 isoform X2 n=1 Tax=Cryptomeria japonica TaxID=3369 RepID=UPI0025ACCC18|nr:uncharacterized protein LOC131037338 isoform X2 [Cryptomeria japonica]